MILPKSQRRRSPTDADYPEFKRDAVTITGRAGDVLVYLGQCWHTISVNRTRAARAALLGQFLPYYFKPMENHAWMLPRSVTAALPPRTVALLGVPYAAFLMHSTRLNPAPRGLWFATRFLASSLWQGWEPAVSPAALDMGLRAVEPQLAPWLGAVWQTPEARKRLLRRAAGLYFAWPRGVAALFVFAAPAAMACVAFGGAGEGLDGPGRAAVLFALGVLGTGLGAALGALIVLERLRM